MCLIQLAANVISYIRVENREKTCEAKYLTCKFFILMKSIRLLVCHFGKEVRRNKKIHILAIIQISYLKKGIWRT